ncbi:TIGR00299 family protein [Haladaptatus sp. W1]|uniref:nickel pincer cofactor biosynthesis protein LarC n=1 Tax=Haladaptatus sp. W1 TaxID=1897478 RepID=UPI00084989D3|nr:nickel pincer cofactor biosynthesis protein LarC [Haladaptatus sp. W1]ODR83443.1 TIGR00299 family protein [Haladaptatus sp. W1]
MRTLAFDGRMGASGDMILGALLDAGANRDALEPVEDALDVEYEVETVVKNGISATSVAVLLTDDGEEGGDESEDGDDNARDDGHDQHHGNGEIHDHGDHHHGDDGDHDEHTHQHDHTHHHEHQRDHDHHHNHQHAEGSGPARTYREVIDVLESMGLDCPIERDAKAVFRILGEAEASVHDTDLDSTHFHEVGTDDAIADIVGASLLLADLDADRIVTTPLATGGGEVGMSHGTFPIPAPAVVEIAAGADWSLSGGPVEAELLTPTGAAILSHFADGVETLPTLNVDGSGYGAGGHDFPDHPNVLRVLAGESSGGLVRDDITVLETNLDDAPPEVLGGLQEILADAGARDVSILPATMKKARPGHVVKVVVKPEDAERVARKLAEETGTLGVRETGVRHRWIAHREFETATLEIDGEELDGGEFDVSVKVARDESGTVYDVSAEFDDALAVATETGLAVGEVMRRAEGTIHENL